MLYLNLTSKIICYVFQIFIGSSRQTVIQNQDVEKDVRIGMMVAVETEGCSFPDVGRITAIKPAPGVDTPVEVQWFYQERATHKPRWLRFFLPGMTKTWIRYSDILLYDFELTKKGSLKKKSREYLQKHFSWFIKSMSCSIITITFSAELYVAPLWTFTICYKCSRYQSNALSIEKCRKY